MCDIIPGEILVSYEKDDPAATALIDQIRENKIEHVSFAGSLEDRLKSMGLGIRPSLKSNFCRLLVPAGAEVFKINYLQFFYRFELLKAMAQGLITDLSRPFFSRTDGAFTVVPNSVLTTCFAFSYPRHDDYKSLFGWTGPSATKRKVLIVDSGILSTTGFNVTDQRNFVDPTNTANVTDDHPSEHGSVIAEIIRDLCPNASLAVYKVIDSKDRASEWDTLAALAADCKADIINMSIAFGLQDQTCSYCGRESYASRSAVFEKMLTEITANQDVIVVGAAGNQGKTELAFPARFPQVVAIESINQAKELSHFSNRSSVSADGSSHKRVFVLPGGERTLTAGAAPTEWIASAKSTDHCGTSFSAAYASAIFAHLWDDTAHSSKTAEQLIAYCASNADTAIPAYASATHGNGLMMVV